MSLDPANHITDPGDQLERAFPGWLWLASMMFSSQGSVLQLNFVSSLETKGQADSFVK
jgi:hypothetical protein